jgi:hypothetical protein
MPVKRWQLRNNGTNVKPVGLCRMMPVGNIHGDGVLTHDNAAGG